MPVTELYAFNLICENLLAALYGVALYVKTVNTVIFAAYSNSYNNSYLEQVASVHLALASLKGLISAIDLIIA